MKYDAHVGNRASCLRRRLAEGPRPPPRTSRLLSCNAGTHHRARRAPVLDTHEPSPVGRIGGWRQQGVRRFAPRHWAARRSRTGDHPGVVAEQQPLERGDDRQLGQEALVLRAQKLAHEAWLRSRASCPLRASTSHSFPLAGGSGATDPIARLAWSDPRDSGSPSH